MLGGLVELLYRYPGACRTAGRGLYSIGGFALLCGAYAHVGTTAVSVATGMAGQPPVSELAQLLPGMWTGWIPESVPAMLCYAALAAGGALLALTSKKVERQLQAL